MTTATPLEDALVGALRVLDDLARRHLTAGDARRDLAALGRRHGLRLRLISDEEPFDGSVRYDVLVRGAGQPAVSLSLAAGPGLPWPPRGMPRSSEFDLVEVDGEKTTVARAVACLDAVFDDVRLMRTVVDSALADQEIDRLGLELTGDELQDATEAYRRARCLYTAEDTAAWLADRGLTPALFARQVEQHALVAKLRGHVAGPGVRGLARRARRRPRHGGRRLGHPGAAARITWYWGDRRQTDRLDDARR